MSRPKKQVERSEVHTTPDPPNTDGTVTFTFDELAEVVRKYAGDLGRLPMWDLAQDFADARDAAG